MMGFDYKEYQRQAEIIRELSRKGKRCPKCRQYRLNTDYQKGQCKGYCILKRKRVQTSLYGGAHQ